MITTSHEDADDRLTGMPGPRRVPLAVCLQVLANQGTVIGCTVVCFAMVVGMAFAPWPQIQAARALEYRREVTEGRTIVHRPARSRSFLATLLEPDCLDSSTAALHDRVLSVVP